MSLQTKSTPIDYQIVTQQILENKMENLGKASIREIKKLIDDIEKASGEKFVRMEMGIPGLPPTKVGVDAEIEALKAKIAELEASKESEIAAKVLEIETSVKAELEAMKEAFTTSFSPVAAKPNFNKNATPPKQSFKEKAEARKATYKN